MSAREFQRRITELVGDLGPAACYQAIRRCEAALKLPESRQMAAVLKIVSFIEAEARKEQTARGVS